MQKETFVEFICRWPGCENRGVISLRQKNKLNDYCSHHIYPNFMRRSLRLSYEDYEKLGYPNIRFVNQIDKGTIIRHSDEKGYPFELKGKTSTYLGGIL